jgi:copper(I)-binding protein
MKKSVLVILILAAALAACAPAPAAGSSIEVTDPWVRTAPATDGMGLNGALFMIINNRAGAPDTLLRVETQASNMAQVHLTEVDASGVSSMHEVDGVEIPAGGSVEFKSGSYHVMLMGLKEGIQEGSTASFTLFFKNAGSVVVEAPVKSP